MASSSIARSTPGKPLRPSSGSAMELVGPPRRSAWIHSLTRCGCCTRIHSASRANFLLPNLLQGLGSRVADDFVLVLQCLGERRYRRLCRRTDLPQGADEISFAVCVPSSLECRDEGRDGVFLSPLVELPEKLSRRPQVARVAALQAGESGLRLRTNCPEEHNNLGTDSLVRSITEDLPKNWHRRLLNLTVADPHQGAGGKVSSLQVLVLERFGEGRHGDLGLRPERSQGTGGAAANVAVLMLERSDEGCDRCPRSGPDPPQGFCRVPADVAVFILERFGERPDRMLGLRPHPPQCLGSQAAALHLLVPERRGEDRDSGFRLPADLPDGLGGVNSDAPIRVLQRFG